MRARFAALAVLSLVGCKRKETPQADAASLAQIFADPTDASGAATASSSVSTTDEPLPSLKHVDVPPPGVVKPKSSASAAAAGDPNLPQCIVARAYCEKAKPECESKKQACIAAGGRM